MSLLASIGIWIKSNIVISIIVGTVVVGGVIATPIIINNYYDNKTQDKQKEKTKQEDKQPITCDDGFFLNNENKCIEITDDMINLNDNLTVSNYLTYYSTLKKKCADQLLKRTSVFVFNIDNDYDLNKLGLTSVYYCFEKNINEEALEEINKLPWHKVYDEITTWHVPLAEIDVQRVAINILLVKNAGHPRNNIYDDVSRDLISKYQLVDPVSSTEDNLKLGEKGNGEKYLLDEQICEDYNLTCGRW